MCIKAALAGTVGLILVSAVTWLAAAADPPAVTGTEAAGMELIEHEAGPHDPPAASRPRVVSPALPPELLRRGPFQSVQVNVDADGNNIVGDAANEPTIAVDPTNPNNIVIGWRQFDSVISNFRQAGWAYSHDGGHTWTFPGVLQEDFFRSDPVLAANADGHFYYYSLREDFTCDGFISIDGGESWSGPIWSYGGDKAWMDIDRTDSAGRGNIYASWDAYGCCYDRWFTRSTDGGATFMYPVSIPNEPYAGTVAVGPAGEVYVGGVSYSTTGIWCARSTNALDPASTPTFDQSVRVNLGGSTSANKGPNPGGLLGQVWVATTRTPGPAQNNVYMLSSVKPSGTDPLDVMFARSTDRGATWGGRRRVNDDPAGTNAWQWFGTMSVAPNGRIDVLWNDTRRTQSEHWSELYYSYSLDAGLMWSTNLPVSPAFDSWLGWPNQNKIGDYFHTASDDTGVNIAYSATFNREEDVYFLRIEPLDCNGNGIADDLDIANGTSTDLNQNKIPDECEPDCDANGLPDAWELSTGLDADCNHNFIPDRCDIASGISHDGNADGIPDECEVCHLSAGQGLAPPDAGASDYFGYSAAMFGDWAVVGASNASLQGERTGRAYVFRKQGTAWTLVAALAGCDSVAGDRFGAAVAIDAGTVVVGAPYHTGAATNSGAAYVFRLTSAGWAQVAALTATTAADNAYFGCAASIHGDTIAIGAYADAPWGSVYMFRAAGEQYVPEGKLPRDEGTGSDYFGCSVSLSDDFVVVGADGADAQGFPSGAAYIFRRKAEGWAQEAKLAPADGAAGDQFGYAVAASGGNLLVSALGTPLGGSVYIYRLVTGSWVQQERLHSPDNLSTAHFGVSIAIDGDVAVVGASGNTMSTDPGAAYVVRRSVAGWFDEAKLTPLDGAAGDTFGRAVAVSGNAGMVAAVFHSVNGVQSGAVYALKGLADCNRNDVLDACDIASGTSADLNADGVPDECVNGKGDVNCDGMVNNQDIDGFVTALLDPAQYALDYPWCGILNGDFNGDTAVNNQDIDGFVQALFGAYPRGDLNCDGLINFQDIDGFIDALFGDADAYDGYLHSFPVYHPCSMLNADFSGDGLANAQDIDGFINALFGG